MIAVEYVTAGPLALGLEWNGIGLLSIKLGWSQNIRPSLDLSGSGLALGEAMEEYIRGSEVQWPDLPFAWEAVTEFQRTVLKTLKNEVCFGQTVTYGELARMVGKPRAAQAVGRAMASNPWPLVIPCHRVVGAGNLGGFSGPGLPMKRALLGIEGAFRSACKQASLPLN